MSLRKPEAQQDLASLPRVPTVKAERVGPAQNGQLASQLSRGDLAKTGENLGKALLQEEHTNVPSSPLEPTPTAAQ